MNPFPPPFGSPPPQVSAPPPPRDEVVEGAEGTRKAVMLRYNDDGEAEVIGVAEGAAAEAMLREARERGVEIRRDADTVDEVLKSGQSSSRVSPEAYELMAMIVDFAQEIDDGFAPERRR